MRDKLKRIVLSALIFALAVPALPVLTALPVYAAVANDGDGAVVETDSSGVDSSGTVITTSYKFYLDELGSGQPGLTLLSDGNPLEVWIGGGKATYFIGETGITKQFDFKAVPIMLYANVVEKNNGVLVSSKYYNVVGGKNIAWGVSDKNSTGIVYVKPGNKNDFISVANGKITAGKRPTDEGKVTYAVAYTTKKVGKSTVYNIEAVLPVVVKSAPAKLMAYSKSNSTAKTDELKAVTTVLGDVSQSVYINPLARDNSKNGLSLSSLTYTVSIDKSATNVALVHGSNTALPGNSITVNADSSGCINFAVKGISITPDIVNISEANAIKREDKVSKAVIVISNNESGKSFKLNVTVGNEVNWVSSDGIGSDGFKVDLKTDAKVSVLDSLTFSLVEKEMIKISNPQYTITTKPTFGVYEAKASGSYTYKDFIDTTKNTIKFPATGKSKDIKIDLIGKDNYHIKVSALKKSNYATPLLQYGVIAYGATEDTILIFPITLTTPQDILKQVKIGDKEINISSDGVHPDVIDLTISASKGSTVKYTSNLNTLPVETLTNGASITNKKLTLADDKQTILTLVYGNNTYYLTINGKDYKPSPLKKVDVHGSKGEVKSDGTVDAISISSVGSDGVSVVFTASDGSVINSKNAAISFNKNGTDATYDRVTGLLRDLSSGQEVIFTIKLDITYIVKVKV